MIWYNPLMGTSCARGDASQRTVTERTVNPTVLCFVIFPPVRRCRPPTARSCCTAPLQTDAVPRVLDPPTLPMTAAVCLYDDCQTVNVNATARHDPTVAVSSRIYALADDHASVIDRHRGCKSPIQARGCLAAVQRDGIEVRCDV